MRIANLESSSRDKAHSIFDGFDVEGLIPVLKVVVDRTAHDHPMHGRAKSLMRELESALARSKAVEAASR
jgi:AmiR/NasT family two-component response regulator